MAISISLSIIRINKLFLLYYFTVPHPGIFIMCRICFHTYSILSFFFIAFQVLGYICRTCKIVAQVHTRQCVLLPSSPSPTFGISPQAIPPQLSPSTVPPLFPPIGPSVQCSFPCVHVFSLFLCQFAENDVLVMKSLTVPMSSMLLPRFFSRVFMVLVVMFEFLIHLELIFV